MVSDTRVHDDGRTDELASPFLQITQSSRVLTHTLTSERFQASAVT